ncbi:hypothetical protein E1267_03830 [Nonomuraea longispora]|uniref:VCBS repeat-containing protein n=1 Tax=Nonomuraea longispora TaxID=1848320 RepID=A0A4R4NM53_9ACTN|nr:FG-GAP-like repeat-containing protein [Nonomuraea longispora]TDC10511.1 hypothetical protein E1267_03830 [Nonomuraea longispora]
MSSSTLRGAATAALAALTIACLSAPAHAVDPPTEPPTGDITLHDVTVQWDTAPCDPDGTTGSDATIASQLNGVLTGRLDGHMTAYKVSCARMVVKAVRDRGMPKRAAAIAITTTIVETNIENVSEMVDHDSLGLFQQRGSWGSAKNRLNPTWATNAFLDKMVRLYPNNSWQSAPVGEVCQAVQVSAHPDRYQPQASDGQKIVDALWTASERPNLHGADFNGDGVSDIFATGTGTLTVWNGKGSNNFTPADAVGANWNTYSRPIGGDFNGDRIGDLAAVRDGTLHIWNGKGGNKFTPAEEVGSGWSHLASSLVSLGDVNKDGRTDIGAVDLDGVLHIWNGKGSNNFAPADRVGAGWNSLSRPVGGDFNGDGIGDIAAVDRDGVLHIWNGKGSNNFTAPDRVGAGWTRQFARTLMSLGDVNGDRHSDLAAVDGAGVLHLWNGRGNNKFTPGDPIGPGWAPHFPAEFGGDFNADGIGDIHATGTGTLHVWNGKGSNNFTPAVSVGTGWTDVSRPVAADFNSDGIGDLAAVRDGTLHIWNGKGDNKFTPAEAVGPGWEDLAATLASLGDVNRDGHADLAAVDTEGVLHIWNGQGNNNFHAPVRVGSGWGAFTRPVGGDFNGDGTGDIAAVSKADGFLHIWNGRGNTKFTPSDAVGPNWEDLAATLMAPGDLNADGHTDLAAINPEGILTLWNGKGDNKFGPAVTIGPNWNEHFPR